MNKKEIELKDLLLNLIKIRSYTSEEEKICTFVYNFLSKSYKPIRIGNNIFCKISEGKEKIALVGHLDTITLEKDRKTIITEKNVEGLGAVDMKSGLAAMLKLSTQSDKIKNKEVSLVFYSGEEMLPHWKTIENQDPGLSAIIEKELLKNINLAIVLEPTDSLIEVGCHGRVLCKHNFKGISAHCAYGNEGKNAIYLAMQFVNKIKNIKLKGDDKISVTGINTHNSSNQIPDSCDVFVDYRFSPELDSKQGKEKYIKLAKKNGEFLDSSSGGRIQKDFIKKYGGKNSLFWTDMARLNNEGIPAINFGPGSPKLAHKDDENIDFKDLEGFYLKLVNFINNYSE